MFHDRAFADLDQQTFAQMGNNAIAYMRKITSEDIYEKFPHVKDVNAGKVFWAMFAADGSLLVLADSRSDLTDSAFYSDLTAIRLN